LLRAARNVCVKIAVEAPDQPDALALLRQSDAFLLGLYAPEFCHLLDVASLQALNVRFYIARQERRALGCAALVIGQAGEAELKRMFVTEAARGMGVGRALLQAVEAAARHAGIRTLLVETGHLNTQALGLYRASGYRDRGVFGDYDDNGVSVFMEKSLG